MVELDDQELERAIERARAVGQVRQRTGPLAERVHYDQRQRALVLHLSTGYAVVIPVRLLQGLAGASVAELRQVSISPARTGIRFLTLDADFTLDGLLAGIFGTERWMQSLRETAAQGGSVYSEAKGNAAPENGEKRGRPRAAKAKNLKIQPVPGVTVHPDGVADPAGDGFAPV